MKIFAVGMYCFLVRTEIKEFVLLKGSGALAQRGEKEYILLIHSKVQD